MPIQGHALGKVSRISAPAISEAEWKVRVDLAAAYRLAARYGWDDLIYTHISARVPGTDEHFLINAFGLAFEEITASNLVKIDHEANIIGESEYPVNGAGFVIHHAIHRGRPELNCVMHLHTEAGMALSMLDCGLLPLSQHAMFFTGQVGYHGYEGIALNMDEQERLIADLGDKRVMILRNHGTLTTGRTVGEAFLWMFYLEKAARSQLMAMAASKDLVTAQPDIAELTRHQHDSAPMDFGEREWPAMLRRLDREDASYRN